MPPIVGPDYTGAHLPRADQQKLMADNAISFYRIEV